MKNREEADRKLNIDNGLKSYARVFRIAFFAIFAAIVVMFIFASKNDEQSDNMLGGYKCKELTSVWFQIDEDGNREVVKLPGTFKSDSSGTTAVETVLPFIIDDGTYLSLRSASSEVSVYIDGALRSQYDYSDSVFSGGDTPSAFLFVKLRETDAAKKLRIETKAKNVYGGYVSRVFYGDQTGILLYYIHDHILEVFMVLFLLVISIVIIIISLVTEKRTGQVSELIYLALGVLFMAGWAFSDCFLRQLFFPRVDIASFTAFVFMSLMPLPFVFYADKIQKGRYRKIYFCLEIFLTIGSIISFTLNISGILSYMHALPFYIFEYILVIAIITGTFLYDVVKGGSKSYRYVYIGALCFMLFAVFEIIYAMQAENSLDKVLLLIGVMILLIFAAMGTVTDFLKAREEKQEAINLSNSKTRFLASMSHEIRTPINTILGMNEMIERECEDKNILGYADNIGNAGRMLLSIINDILDFSKIESGKMELSLIKYQTASLINDCVALLKEKAESKNLKMVVSCSRDTPSAFLGDDVRLKQIITNILTNAVKYTQKGSVTLTVTGEKLDTPEKGSDKDYMLHISVKDTGIGIKEESLDKIFMDFSRTDNIKNRHIEGTGLGLAITKLLTEAMGGDISVKSEYGKGSEFIVNIPQHIEDKSPMGDLEKNINSETSKKKYQVMFTAPKAKVLVVDDNKMNLMVFLALLKKTSMQIDKATGGLAALELSREKKYDIIFMDHMMPDMDGMETLKAIRSEEDNPNKDTCTIALTANAIAGIDKVYLDAGFQDYLAKPVDPKKLERMVMKHLDKDLVILNEDADDEDKEEEDA